MRIYLLVCTALTSLAACLAPFAQERTAGGALHSQMSWAALSSSIESVSGRVTMSEVILKQVVTCGKKGMTYAPDVSGRDTDNCVHSAAVQNILRCNALGQVYSQSTGNCINTAATAPRCSIHVTGGHRTSGGRSGSAATCPSGYSPVMTGAAHTTGCNTDHGNCALSESYLCYRQLCQ